MFNPLLEDLSKLKDAELELKIIDLSKKYHTAARFGQGMVCDQIIVILTALKEEQSQRNQNMFKKSPANQNKDLGDLINVG
jgi:hypothetical protein